MISSDVLCFNWKWFLFMEYLFNVISCIHISHHTPLRFHSTQHLPSPLQIHSHSIHFQIRNANPNSSNRMGQFLLPLFDSYTMGRLPHEQRLVHSLRCDSVEITFSFQGTMADIQEQVGAQDIECILMLK